MLLAWVRMLMLLKGEWLVLIRIPPLVVAKPICSSKVACEMRTTNSSREMSHFGMVVGVEERLSTVQLGQGNTGVNVAAPVIGCHVKM